MYRSGVKFPWCFIGCIAIFIFLQIIGFVGDVAQNHNFYSTYKGKSYHIISTESVYEGYYSERTGGSSTMKTLIFEDKHGNRYTYEIALDFAPEFKDVYPGCYIMVFEDSIMITDRFGRN